MPRVNLPSALSHGRTSPGGACPPARLRVRFYAHASQHAHARTHGRTHPYSSSVAASHLLPLTTASHLVRSLRARPGRPSPPLKDLKSSEFMCCSTFVSLLRNLNCSGVQGAPCLKTIWLGQVGFDHGRVSSNWLRAGRQERFAKLGRSKILVKQSPDV